jgi:hypothetical protein
VLVKAFNNIDFKHLLSLVGSTRNSSNESAPTCPNMDRSASAGQTLGKSEPSL